MLVSNCFIPNSSSKISNHIIDLKNPFSKIANIIDGCYPRLHLQNQELFLMILYEKIIQCNKHKYIALSINIDKGKNIWRMLENMHSILFNNFDYIPKKWQSLIILLKSTKFNNGIKNRENGILQIYSLTYSALNFIEDFVINNIDDDKEFIYDKNFGVNFDILMSKYQTILEKFIINCEIPCTCNNYKIFPDNIKNTINDKYIRVHINIINDMLNDTAIEYNISDYEQNYMKSTYNLLCKPPFKTIRVYHKIINISYDILPEKGRIDYVKNLVRNRTNENIYYDHNYNETRNFNSDIIENTEIPFIYKITNKMNKCFVCDHDLLSDYNYVNISNNNIIETDKLNVLTIGITYPIICRCRNCKNGRYGSLLLNNDHVIMARNYKWMTFYLGLINTMPKDILWVIIMLYQNFR
jgi:hypothetical protein